MMDAPPGRPFLHGSLARAIAPPRALSGAKVAPIALVTLNLVKIMIEIDDLALSLRVSTRRNPPGEPRSHPYPNPYR